MTVLPLCFTNSFLPSTSTSASTSILKSLLTCRRQRHHHHQHHMSDAQHQQQHQNQPLPSQPINRVSRLSLPTTRELSHLSDIHVRRNHGRPLHYAKTPSFALSVWSLSVQTRENIPLEEVYVNTLDERNHREDNENDADVGGFVNAPLSLEEESSDISTATTATTATTIAPILNQHEKRGDGDDDRDLVNDPSILDQNSDISVTTTTATNTTSTPFLERQEHEHEQETKTTVDNNRQQEPEQQPEVPRKRKSFEPKRQVPQWAYICSIRASKSMLGKRAVQRNRAKRRMRAAAAQILPQYAVRGMEYRFTLHPDILIISHTTLLNDVLIALKTVRCFSLTLTIEMLRREKYNER